MRKVRYLVLVVVVCVVSAVAVASPREKKERVRDANPVVRMVKNFLRALGDGLVTPTP